ncbi:ion channel [Swingsia samuiensis]|uniref:ATP-sensitive inward rectifier potassium channel 10 n=1 Tax=Swingsia samuiensis TaxID=1293412 RepID=A0A4Y6UIL5_9PROT|nr:ion channel [Swingsia samuiensis]QDH16670.1 hypothetical protein E3D00_03075 [Swingsia samuiensis]
MAGPFFMFDTHIDRALNGINISYIFTVVLIRRVLTVVKIRSVSIENKKNQDFLSFNNIELLNVKKNRKNDLYHYFMTIGWIRFSLITALFYFVACLFFAVLLYPEWQEITSLKNPSIGSLFFFSVETMSTVGFGFMAPTQAVAHTVVSIELFVGVLINAVVTGLVFARFTRATSMIKMSDNIVLYKENGKQFLGIQIHNERSNRMLSLNVEATLLKIVKTSNHAVTPTTTKINVNHEFIPTLKYYRNIWHEIDETSPLYGITEEDRQRDIFAIFVYISGMDDITMQTVFSYKIYQMKDVKVDHIFDDIMTLRDDGKIIFDVSKAGKVKLASSS